MKYQIRRGFRAPTPFLDEALNQATYDVYRKQLFGDWIHIQTCNTREAAEKYIQTSKDMIVKL